MIDIEQLEPGVQVVFHPKVFLPPYAPHYDPYLGHTFRVVALHEGDHVQLVCVDDPKVVVRGYVHDDELLLVTTEESA